LKTGVRQIGFCAVLAALLAACAPSVRHPDLGRLYNDLAQAEDPYRNPIIVIPGLLGSRLVQQPSGKVVWGAFGLGHVDPDTPEGARMVALPMRADAPLSDLTDDLVPDGALDRLIYNVLGVPLELNAYYNILSVLGVGGYRDQGLAGAIDYGAHHFTCFQFDYDWRRDIVESAARLDRFIKDRQAYVREEIQRRFGIAVNHVKFDIVAHSMGGLVARYYLRYGTQDLPEDGSLPALTWEGARHIEHLVLIGPPNAGALDALLHLTSGIKPGTFFPTYPAAIVGTMPSAYQLLPRTRHHPVLDSNGLPIEDIYDPRLWQRNQWGLADPRQETVIEHLLPEIADLGKRRNIALDHQTKALDRAKLFAAAMDAPGRPPAGTRLFLVAGDAAETNKTAQFDDSGRLTVVATDAGDGSVLRSSALLDERLPSETHGRLKSPIVWHQAMFLFSDHLGLTRDPAFTDNILYFLLEQPRR
jgi:pimeloyl-ACP methyl ester carboxylesterase